MTSTDRTAWVLTADAGKVLMKVGQGGEASAPFNVGAWNEARFSHEMVQGALSKRRTIKIYVNGEQLAKGHPLGHHGDLEQVFFRASGGRVVIAGAELVGW